MDKIEQAYLYNLKEDSNQGFMEELQTLLDRYNVSIGVDIHHASYPYNNIEAIIKFKNKNYDVVGEYKTEDLYLEDD